MRSSPQAPITASGVRMPGLLFSLSRTLTPGPLTLVRKPRTLLCIVVRDFSTLLRQKTRSFRTEGPERQMVLAAKPENQQII